MLYLFFIKWTLRDCRNVSIFSLNLRMSINFITLTVFSILNLIFVFPIMLSVRAHSIPPDSLQPHGLQSTRLHCPWNFPGKHTAVDCHFLIQGTFPTQGLNLHLLHLLHWQVDSLQTINPEWHYTLHLFLKQEFMAGTWGTKNTTALFMLFMREHAERTRLSASLILYFSQSIKVGMKCMSLPPQHIILFICVTCTKNRIQVPHRILGEPKYFAG